MPNVIAGADALAIALVTIPANAQATDGSTAAQAAASSDDKGRDIMVNGIREGIGNAVNGNRRSARIVESVASEDFGKLPDNTVPEALARVAGVQIDRADYVR